MKLTIILPRVKNSFFSLSLILSAVNILCTSAMLWQITYLAPTFQLISIIPAVYTLVFIVCRRFADFTSPGCFTIHLIGFLRYMLTPFIIVTSKQLSAMEHAFDDIGSAVLIMIIEMIFIFGATLLYNPHDIVRPADKIRFPSIIKFLAIMAFLFFAIDNRSLIGNLSVFSGKVTVEDTNATSGIVSIIWQALCAFIFCFIINDIASNRRHKRLLLLSLVCGLIYLLVIFTGQTELSHWYTIVTLIAMTFWMFIQFVDEAYYDFGDDGKSRGKYTGLFEENGDTYYAIAGNKMHGWHQIGDDWYYFRSSTYKAAQGVIKFNFGDIPITFEFDNGRMLSGQWVETSTGTRYYNGPVAYTRTWAEIDGKKYYFDENSNLVRGYFIIKDSRYSHDDDYRMYKFNDKTGVLEEAMTSTGLLVTDNGTYYLDNGYAKHGLFKVGNDYYYFNSTHKAVTGNYYVGEEYLNGLDFKPGYYDFDENGKLIDKNGIYDIDGTLYYLVHGEKTYAGIIELDGATYYVHSDGRVATGKTWVTKTNDKVEQGYYLFADDGKMINTGIFEEDGTLYYYEGGKKTYAGLIDFEGATYYVHSDGRVATGETWVTKTNDNMAQGYYLFAADGKMIDTGVYEVDGTLYYFENGKKTYAGIVKVGDDYYYAHSQGNVATSETWVTKTNGIVDQGYYLFGADGKMVHTGVYDVDGTLYYFENGKKTYAGLVKVGDDYYYVHSQGNVATGKTWVTKTNGIVSEGYYNFGDDGKMILD